MTRSDSMAPNSSIATNVEIGLFCRVWAMAIKSRTIAAASFLDNNG